jgi:hypothetical protein
LKRNIASLFFLFLFFILGCNQADVNESRKTIDVFYGQYKPGDYRVVDKSLLSKAFGEKINLASAKQAASAEELKAMGSTDKPLMIEGDIYTSLYEGATSHEIGQIDNVNGNMKAVVKFVNDPYKHNWTDTVILIKEDGSWKIDNVLYTAKQGSARSVRDVLDVFLRLP